MEVEGEGGVGDVAMEVMVEVEVVMEVMVEVEMEGGG